MATDAETMDAEAAAAAAAAAEAEPDVPRLDLGQFLPKIIGKKVRGFNLPLCVRVFLSHALRPHCHCHTA